MKADHHMLKLELNITFHMKKDHERKDMFNLKDKIRQKQLKIFTTNTNRFTRCFENKEIFDVQFKSWQRQLLKSLHANFRQIQVKDEDYKKELSKIYTLINKKRNIRKQQLISAEDHKTVEGLEVEIGNECEEKNGQN